MELNDYLQNLQQRIPLVSDKALIDLVNGIDVNRDLIHYRKSRGYFGQLFESLTGSDRKRQLLLDGNLIAGQEALYNWIIELTDTLSISQVALKITQQSLLEAREAIRNRTQDISFLSQKLEISVEEINIRLNQLESRLESRIDDLEFRFQFQLDQRKVKDAAETDLDRILSAWRAGRTYTNLPWVIQIAFLVREIFSSSVAIYEKETGDTEGFRSRVVDKILEGQPKTDFGLPDLLDLTCKELETDDKKLTAALLEVRSLPFSRLQNTPLLFTIGTSLELAVLPPKSQPQEIGRSALTLCREKIKRISITTDTQEFVTTLVQETANDCVNLIR